MGTCNESVALADVEARIRELFGRALRDEAAGWEQHAALPREVIARIAATGAFAARWPTDSRDPGNAALGVLLVQEMALCSVGACIALGTHLEVYFRALSRSAYGRERWADAIDGRAIGAFAVSEYSGGSNPSNCRTTATRTPDGWRLDGRKHYVSNAASATELVMFTRTSDVRDLSDFTVFLVPTDAPGVTIVPHEIAGARASGTCRVEIDGVELSDDHRVGGVGRGLVLLLEFLRGERIAAAAGSVAVAELCLEIALTWLRERRSGPGALREKQALVHRLASLSSEVAAARALLDDRVRRAQAGRLTSAQAAEAKFFIGRLAWRVADEAMQILAGHGYTEETPFAALWRDVRIGRIGGGTDEVQLELIAQGLHVDRHAEHPLVAAIGAAAVPGGDLR
jgi:acyl-CoA dehydrogenase